MAGAAPHPPSPGGPANRPPSPGVHAPRSAAPRLFESPRVSADDANAEPSLAARVVEQLDIKLRSFGRQVAGQSSHYHDRSGMTLQIVSLMAMLAVITLFGLIFHIIHPRAAHDRVSDMLDDPSPPPPPPPFVPANWPPQPPRAPYPRQPPSLPGAPAPPPEAWWQRRRSVSEVTLAAWIELLLCILLCFVAPPAWIKYRRWRMRRQRERRVIANLIAGSRMRHTRLAEEAPDTPTGRLKGAVGKTLLQRLAAAEATAAAAGGAGGASASGGAGASSQTGSAEMQEVSLGEPSTSSTRV